MATIYSIQIKVVNGALALTPTHPIQVGDYVTWCPDYTSGINKVHLDFTSCPFPNGGPCNWVWDSTSGPCYPCPAVVISLRGKFSYSVCACVGSAPNNESLVVHGELDVS